MRGEDGSAGIARDLAAIARRELDLVVIGGGIYGAALLLEAADRGLRAILVEKDDFGGGTTRNSLRIGHGGLRYLQHLDLRRHRESVLERRWLLCEFPEWVEPLRCLMPLHSGGLRLPAVLRVALAVDDLLARDRDRGVDPSRRLAAGQVVSAERVAELFPGVRPDDLRGGAIWSDTLIPHLPRWLLELLHRACEQGSGALNYVEATGLLREREGVAGITATDRLSGEAIEIRAPCVVNAAGPACRDLARRLDRDHPELFEATLAWNVLLDVEPASEHALAVAPPRPGAQTYFLVPWQGRLLAGTGHAAWRGGLSAPPRLGSQQLEAFVADLAAAAPGLGIRVDRVLRIYAGFLPGRKVGGTALATRPVVVDHGAHGGPPGLWSVSGVKLTTARRVADRTLRRIFPGRARSVPGSRPARAGAERRAARTRFGPRWQPLEDPGWLDAIRLLVAEESVHHLDDLILRRTSLGDDPRIARAVAPELCAAFGWDAARRSEELARLERSLAEAMATDASMPRAEGASVERMAARFGA